MRIALHDADKTNYPNLALMKLSAWHKAQGHSVEWFNPLMGSSCDVIYSSKVFSWTPESLDLPSRTIRGGTGYGSTNTLPTEVESICPDYSLYNYMVKKRKRFVPVSIGLLTRGCPNNCPWCIVPEKEGAIRKHASFEEFTRHPDVVLMDNNVLAHSHGIEQIEKMARKNLCVDFNQGLDARLIDTSIAKRLAALRWLRPVRLACDHQGQMPIIEKAVQLLRNAGVTPKRYSCYVLVKDIEDAHERVKFLLGLGIDPFAQPYRDKAGTEPTLAQKDFATWVDRHYCKVVQWEEFKPRRAA